MLMIVSVNHTLAVLTLIPLPIWTWYIIKFGKGE